MKKKTAPVNTVKGYLSSFPLPVKALLEKIRNVITSSAPDAEEVLSYRMPAYKYHGMLVYFAAHTHHIGFYPFTSAIQAFKKDLSPYEGAKGSVKFPFDKPLPLELISKIVKFRVKENLEKAKKNQKK
jgi:uncharacterized protein YdhG (YjbR/CyaY superfamily)